MREVWVELSFLGKGILTGMALRLCYDVLRLIRVIIPHGKILAAAEDLIYWIVSAVILFMLMYQTYDGALRGVMIFFVFLGMLVFAIIDKKIELRCRRLLKRVKNGCIMSLLRFKGEVRHGEKQRKRSEKNPEKSKQKK